MHREQDRVAPGAENDTEPGSPTAGRRALWTFTDQALSSLTNAGVAIVVAVSVSREDFGAFSLALVTFSFAVGLGRALVGEPFLVRYSAADPQRRREAMSRATGTTVTFSLLAAGVCLVVALLTSGQTAAAYLALAVCLPGLCLQDTWRHIFFAAGRPASATLNDLVWTVLQFSALGLLLTTGNDSIFLITLAWGGAACVAAVFGLVQTRVVPRVRSTGSWLHQTRDLNAQLALGYVMNAGSVQIGTYAVGGLVGVVGVGALRAAQVLLGPLNLVFAGFNSFILPLLARRIAAGQRLLGVAAAGSAALGTLATVWTTFLLLLPDAAGRRILGDSWDGAERVLLPSGLVLIAGSLALGASNSLVSLSRADLMLRLTAVQAPLILGLGVFGAWQFGFVGAAYGFAIAQSIGLVLCWSLFVRAEAKHFRV